jgi:RHS repeat-associated protein
LLTAFGGFTVSREVASALPTRLADGTAEHDLTFDAVGRLQSRAWGVNGAPVYIEQVSYDAAGRVAQRTETVSGTTSAYAYTYDANGFLATVTKNGVAVEEYAYDARGNRTSRTANGGATEASTYDLQDRLQTRHGTLYSFDADGFLAQRGADTFDFGARGEMLGAVVDGQSVTYGYDGYGRRTSRTTAAGPTQFLYGNPQHQLQLTASRDTAGVLTTYFYDEGGRLIAFERSGARYYVAGDMLGTPKAVVDANGTVVKTMAWDAFGSLLSDSNAGFALEIGFAGGLRDPLTGLTRFGVRDYEPASGRWTSRDPALFATRQTNLYAYVANDSVNKIDPVGLFSFGASAYDGLGGGIKLAITGEGISFCAEVGIGGGESIEVDPSGGLDKDGVSLDAAVSLKAGPLGGFEVGSSLKGECQLENKAKGCLGPLCVEGTYKDGQWQPRTGKAETSIGDFTALATKSLAEAAKFKLEGKVVGNFCAAGKW